MMICDHGFSQKIPYVSIASVQQIVRFKKTRKPNSNQPAFMINLIAVALGGALGAVMRFSVGFITVKLIGRSNVITGTVVSNIAGCFLAGIGLAWLTSGANVSTVTGLFLTVGVLGSLTTFSTFALETFQLLKRESLNQLFGYLFLQVVIAFLITAAGFWLYHWMGGS
jgi:fluoride exporter